MQLIKKLFAKYRGIIIYILCSLMTAGIETAVSWYLIKAFACPVVYANTAAMLIGAVVHYFCTLAFVFELKSSVKSALGYIITFINGLVLQNLIIWLCYDRLFHTSGIFWQYLISKGLSLVIPFCLTYYLRKRINAYIAKKQEEGHE